MSAKQVCFFTFQEWKIQVLEQVAAVDIYLEFGSPSRRLIDDGPLMKRPIRTQLHATC